MGLWGALCLALAWLVLTSGHPGLSIVAAVTVCGLFL